MDIRPPAYRQHHPPLDSFRVWSENQSYGCSLPTSPSSINFWREPLHAPRHSEYQGGASGRYPLISPIGISVLQSFGLQLPFDFVRKLFTYERVARLSFPYPSRRFTTPHTPRPAPIATTRVFKVVIALLKNAIYIHQNWLLSGVYGNEKTPTKKPAHPMSVIPFLIIFRSFPRLLRQFYVNHFHLFFGFRCVLRI